MNKKEVERIGNIPPAWLICRVTCVQVKGGVGAKKVKKGRRWMPWLSEAMKDAISCEKHGVGANSH